MKCRGCPAEIEFLQGPNGRAIPVQRVTAVYIVFVDAHANRWLEKLDLSRYGEGYYVSHFQTCPQAARFSRRRRPVQDEKENPDDVR